MSVEVAKPESSRTKRIDQVHATILPLEKVGTHIGLRQPAA